MPDLKRIAGFIILTASVFLWLSGLLLWLHIDGDHCCEGHTDHGDQGEERCSQCQALRANFGEVPVSTAVPEIRLEPVVLPLFDLVEIVVPTPCFRLPPCRAPPAFS